MLKILFTGQLILSKVRLLRREDLIHLNESAVSKVCVRSVLTCQAKRGVCAPCYGYDLSKGEFVDIGATVGIIAAQSIGEPGTQLTMRTFHIGGTASGLGDLPYFSAKNDGIVEWRGIRIVTNRQGQMVVMSRKARLVILSPDGRELQRHDLEYGSTLLVNDKQEVKIGTQSC